MTPARISRLWQIQRVFRRYRLGEFLGRKVVSDPRPRGQRLRMALEELGPVFVKFGQALSTRPDILPPDVARELAQLQDRVPPFPGAEAQRIIEKALGKPIDQLFAEFDPQPLASASIAQVHVARLHADPNQQLRADTIKFAGGSDAGSRPGVTNDAFGTISESPCSPEVVIKVLRPDVEKHVERDVALLRTLADYAEMFVPRAKRMRPRAVVAEYEKVIFDELDLMREGANAMLLRRNWLGSALIYHPIVFWDYTRPNVLVMERIHGVSLRELDHLRELNVNFQVLAERGVEIFFNQVFRDNFFHADMHPGNIFVDVSDPQKPGYLAVDFGIVGSLSDGDQRYLAENFLAFFNRDYKRVAELHVESGWIPEGTRVEEFESAIRTVCEPIFEKPLKDISFGFFLLRLFQVARRFNYQVQPQLVLLQKTLLTIEGLGRQLYPELDLWKTAKPIMEDWMRQRIGPGALMSKFRAQAPALAQTLPGAMKLIIRQLESGRLPSALDGSGLEALRREIRNTGRRMSWMIAGATFWMGAALVYGFAVQTGVPGSAALAVVSALGLAGVFSWIRAVTSARKV